MTNSVRYTGSTERGPSGELWKGNAPCDGEFFMNPNKGWGFFDDFQVLPATGNLYSLVEADAASSIAILVAEESGVVRLATTTTDNHEASIGFGDATTAPLVIDEGLGECFFEARIRTSSITDNVVGLLLGLCEEGGAIADIIVDDGADISDNDFVGFYIDAADGDSIDIIYQTAGSAFGTLLAGAAVPVAATWIKLGLHFDGSDTVRFYVNGAEVASCAPSLTGFPDGEEMTTVLATKVSSAATLNVDMDWWAFAQEAV